MRKFLNLMHNEWKKLFCKKSTWVLLILLAVVTIGLGVLLIANSTPSEVSYLENFESAKQHYEKICAEMEADGISPDSADYREARIQLEYYTYMDEHELEMSDWRLQTGVIRDMCVAKVGGDTENYERFRAIVEDEDLAAYHTYMYELYVADQPSAEEIYAWERDYLIEHEVEPTYENPLYMMLVGELRSAKMTILRNEGRENLTEAEQRTLQAAKDTRLLCEYRLEHEYTVDPSKAFETSYTGGDSQSLFWNILANSASLMLLVGIICIIFAGGIVANEFSAGTVKFLLINPVSRWKILMSKYVTVLSMGLLMGLIIFVVSFCTGLFAGAWDAFTPILEVENGELVHSSPYWLLLKKYLLSCVEILVMTTLAFAISSLARSTAFAVGISLLAYLSGALLVTLLMELDCDWGRYLIFANMDLSAIADGKGMFPYQTLGTAIVVVVLHMAVFLWTAWDGFVRREV